MNLKQQVARHHFQFKKKYGQNFITDVNLLNRIVAAAGIAASDDVLEIGPGAGSLTAALADVAQTVVAIEIDKSLAPLLADALGERSNVTIHYGDALSLDWDALMDEQGGAGRSYKLVANLPYYITTPLIMAALEGTSRVSELHVMVQKEVAERFVASPGTKAYGAITVMLHYYSHVQIAMPVSRKVFTPMPAVDSAVISIHRYTERPLQAVSDKLLRQVVKAAFGQRRKTLNNALKVLGDLPEVQQAALAGAGIDGGRRGESLTVAEFVHLADAFAAARGIHKE